MQAPRTSSGIWKRVADVTRELQSRPMHSHLVDFKPILTKLETGQYQTPADWYRDVNSQYSSALARLKTQMEKDVCYQMTYQFQKLASGLNVSNAEQWAQDVQSRFMKLDTILQECPYQLILDHELISLVEANAERFPASREHVLATSEQLRRILKKGTDPNPETDISNFYLGAFRNKIIDIDDFRMIKELGSSSYARVTLEEHVPSGKLVAVKTLSGAGAKRQVECFCREVSILAMHKHPCILPFFGFTNIGRDSENELIIATDYMKNGTLRDLLNEESCGKAPKEWNGTKKSIVAFGIACGMNLLHQCRVVHRDLKSLNILIDENFEPKIADMGLAKFIHEGELQTMRIGSYPWMAPEVLFSDNYNEKADIYSYAMILYELVTLRYPFSECTDQRQIQFRVMNRKRPILDKNTPENLAMMIQRCWAQDPRERPSFAEIIAQFKAEECLFPDTNLEFFRAYKLKVENDDVNFKISLIIAVQHSFNEVIKQMLFDGYPNVNETDEEERTPLHIAVINGLTETVRILLDCEDVDVNAFDRHTKTPLHYAVAQGDDTCVRLLMTRTDLIMSPKDADKNTPLHTAVINKQEEIVGVLVSRRDCLVNSVNGSNETPLTIAFDNNLVGVIARLAATGRVKMETPVHRPLIHRAIEAGNVDITRALLQIPSINVNDKISDATPLQLAVGTKNMSIILALLVYPQVDLSPDAVAPIVSMCLEQNQLLLLQILLELDRFDPNAGSHFSMPPLLAAVRANNLEAVALLLSCARVDVNVQDTGTGNTALHFAVGQQNVEMVRLLLRSPKINAGVPNNENQTPRMMSTRSKIHKMLKKRD